MCIRCLSLRLIHLTLRNPIMEVLYPLVQACQANQASVLRDLSLTTQIQIQTQVRMVRCAHGFKEPETEEMNVDIDKTWSAQVGRIAGVIGGVKNTGRAK